MQTFAGVARRVENRMWLRKSLMFLRKTWPYALLAVGMAGLLRGLGAEFVTLTFGLVPVLLWLAGAFILAWKKKPSPYAALSFWDQKTSRQDAFANAWWFEQRPDCTEAERLHLVRNRSLLPEAVKSLEKDIALPQVRWLTLIPLSTLLILLLPQGNGLHLPDMVLNQEGRDRAVKEGKKLAEKTIDPAKMQSLSEAEKKELEKLQSKLQDTAKTLQDENSKTAREVLAELEKSARDAERLAAKLGAGDAAWASEQMVSEMRKYADTSEIGDATANKSAENTAREAQKIADKLKDEKLSRETLDRFEVTLKEIGAQGQPEDKERTVGQHLLKADKDMSQTLPQEAGKEFQALADKMRTLAAREKAREQLEKLAQQLRQSGSDIAGQGSQGMQQLAGNQGQSGQGNQGSQASPQQMQAMQNAPQMQPMQNPGMSNAPQGQGQQGNAQQMQAMTPVPGSGQPAPQPGSGQQGNGQNNKPMLIAPIPGTQPGQQGNIAILGSIPGSTPGGLQAGNGTAVMGNTPTPQSKAGSQATVNAQRNTDGASSVRAVEGQAHPENANRSAQATTIQTITAEENALDDQSLPPARREQVRRYFTELRKRFEKQP